MRNKASKDIYVSYFWRAGSDTGFGGINIKLTGIFSHKDIKSVSSVIESQMKLDLGSDKDVKIVILNWCEYDKS